MFSRLFSNNNALVNMSASSKSNAHQFEEKGKELSGAGNPNQLNLTSQFEKASLRSSQLQQSKPTAELLPKLPPFVHQRSTV